MNDGETKKGRKKEDVKLPAGETKPFVNSGIKARENRERERLTKCMTLSTKFFCVTGIVGRYYIIGYYSFI